MGGSRILQPQDSFYSFQSAYLLPPLLSKNVCSWSFFLHSPTPTLRTRTILEGLRPVSRQSPTFPPKQLELCTENINIQRGPTSQLRIQGKKKKSKIVQITLENYILHEILCRSISLQPTKLSEPLRWNKRNKQKTYTFLSGNPNCPA